MKIRLFSIVFLLSSCSTPSSHRDIASVTADLSGEPTPFTIHAMCSVTCENQNEQNVLSAKDIFDPNQGPPIETNGGFAPNLSLRLSNQADQLCLKTAIQICGSERAISKVSSQSLKSGRWSIPLPLNCSKTGKCAISPYQDPKQLERVQTVSQHSFRISPFRSVPPSTCASEMSFESCFGDCMSNHLACSTKGEYIETIMTPDHGADSHVKVCMDELEQKFRREKTPKAIRPILCGIYARETLLRQQHEDLSCTAFRLNTDPCESYSKTN